MTVHALMPLIHDRLTGGSSYNRRVLDYLARSARIELHLDSPGESGGLWLVDSLCIQAGASHLRRTRGANGVLIAHYLQVIDSRQGYSERAQQELEALEAYDAVVTTSLFAQSRLAECGFHGEVEAISPGLDSAYRAPVPHRALHAARILTVASLVPDKGPMEMLDALESLAELEWTWEIIGDTELDIVFADAFRARLNQSPVQDRVFVRGTRAPEEVVAALDRCDVFALPSHFETCSMATMEAMARGLPVVAFRVGGLPDLLPEASRRMLAAAGDYRGFAVCLRLFLDSSEHRRIHGEANRRASERFPDWESSGFALESVLKRVSPRVG